MRLRRFLLKAIICAGVAVPIAAMGDEERSSEGLENAENPWAASQLIQPEELVRRLSVAAGSRPTVLYIGPSILFRSGHIPSARYVGPAAQAPALEELQRQLRTLTKGSEIVLYCGCCPWEHCPNIRPAFNLIVNMGFTKASLLHLPRSFKEDWTDRGFPVRQDE